VIKTAVRELIIGLAIAAFGIAISVLGIANFLFGTGLLLVCGLLSTWWISTARIQKRSKWRWGVVIVIVLALTEWCAIEKRPDEVKPAPPSIAVSIPMAMPTEGTIWTFSESTRRVHPIDVILEFRFQNLKPHTDEITGFRVEVLAPNWTPLTPVYLYSPSLEKSEDCYMGPDLKSARKAVPQIPDLFLAIRDRPLETGKVVKAVGLYQYNGREEALPRRFRVTLTDGAGRISVTELNVGAPGNLESVGFKLTDETKDLSSFQQERYAQ
jgi:hypothetical protein